MVKEKILTPKDVTAPKNRCGAAALQLHAAERLFPGVPDSCELTVACAPEHYSASRIARAVEDCDAHLLNLNVMADRLPTGEMSVLLRAGLRNASMAARSLERYGYRVVALHTDTDAGADATVDDTLSERISELIDRFGLE